MTRDTGVEGQEFAGISVRTDAHRRRRRGYVGVDQSRLPIAEGYSSMDILPFLDELQTIACNGLNYATNPYDRERYERLMELASAYYGQALDLPPSEARGRLRKELGYITPKVGAEAAVLDSEGRILLVRRSDDGRWCLPCGWVEPNESPAEAAVRETREETGLVVRPTEAGRRVHQEACPRVWPPQCRRRRVPL